MFICILRPVQRAFFSVDTFITCDPIRRNTAFLAIFCGNHSLHCIKRNHNKQMRRSAAGPQARQAVRTCCTRQAPGRRPAGRTSEKEERTNRQHHQQHSSSTDNEQHQDQHQHQRRRTERQRREEQRERQHSSSERNRETERQRRRHDTTPAPTPAGTIPD